jgi:predicted dehydrogenase
MAQEKNINRRQFLREAACAVVGAVSFPYIVPSSALGKADSVSPSNRITLGCIGMGGQGTWDMAGFLRHSDVQVVAVCDVNKGSSDYDSFYQFEGSSAAGREPARQMVESYYAKRKPSGGYKGCVAYGDFRELLARDDIDAILIAVPDQWHSIPAVMAAKSGKDVYAEKPLAYTIAEGRAICDAVKRYGIVWQTGSQQRSDYKFRRACELVRNGRIGKVHTVKVGLPYGSDISEINGKLTKPAPVPEGFDYDMWLGPAPLAAYCPGRCHWNWRWISDYSGGQITDWAGHHIDIAHWGMGTEYSSPVEIEGKAIFPRAEDGLYDVAESYRFVCKYAEGFTMIVADSSQIEMGVLFEGTEGWIHVNRGGLSAHPESVLDSVIRPDEINLYKSNDHIGNFIDCVKSRSQTIAPAEVAHHSIMVGHLGLIGIKMGRRLKWDNKKERFVNDAEADRLLSRPMRSPWHL